MAQGYAIGPKTPTKVLSSNSTTTPLNTGNTFTGTWTDCTGYEAISVALKTDQNGYLTVQYSPDGTNVDSTITRYYRTTQVEPPHVFKNARPYVRVTFTNDSGTNQTYLRLVTQLCPMGQLNIPADSIIAQDYDAISVRPTSYTEEVALGRRQGQSTWNKFGYNNDIDIATSPEIVAAYGGTFQYVTAGETLTIVSSSTDDDGDPAGVGANSIVLYGVDSNWAPQTEVVALNGTTNVVTSSSWIGINRAAIYLAGSSKTNVGNITITFTSSGYTAAYMPAGEGTTQQCVYYVPADHQFLATWLYFNAIKVSAGTEPVVTLKGWVYSAVSNAVYEVYRDSLDTANDNRILLPPPEPFVVGEKSILYFTAASDKDNTAVRGRFSGKLIKDVDAA